MIVLNELEEQDKSLIYNWICDSELRKMTGTRGLPDEESHAIWFDKKMHDKNNYIRTIVHDGIKVGIIGTNNIDTVNKNANIYLYIGAADKRKKGIASQALQLFSNYLFEECHCHKLVAFVRSYNEPSIRLFQKNGFICEGIQKEQILYENKYYDRIIFGLINGRDEERTNT